LKVRILSLCFGFKECLNKLRKENIIRLSLTSKLCKTNTLKNYEEMKDKCTI